MNAVGIPTVAPEVKGVMLLKCWENFFFYAHEKIEEKLEDSLLNVEWQICWEQFKSSVDH